MRILLVHNFYGSTAPSGENKVFEAEKSMLEKHGETVDVFTRHSDEIRLVVSGWWLVVSIRRVLNLIKGALCTIGNPFAARALKKKIRAFKPDVVHFHNQFPLISPLALRAARKCGVKVVMTLHNYRTVCAAGIPMRDGKVCRECFLSQTKRGEAVKWRRERAKRKVEEWLQGVDDVSFATAIERLVDEKSAAGEYLFERREDLNRAIVAAKAFYADYSRRIVELSDGRCVYFAPDPRSKVRNADNAMCWAEYAFHAVSSGGDKIPGKNYTFRKYNEYKVVNIDLIEPTLRSEKCVPVLKNKAAQDAVKFFGAAHLGGLFDVVVRLDEYGNANANMTEVTFEASSKRSQKKPPQLVSLAEAVRTVVSHQTATGTYPPNGDMLANPFEMRKGGRKRHCQPQPSTSTLSVRPALRYKCYRGSLVATLPLAVNIWLYRHCWAKWVDTFIVLSEFQKKIMVECGFPAEKIVVKGNFVNKVEVEGGGGQRKTQVIFVGRMGDEKGVPTLIEAWRILEQAKRNGEGEQRRLLIVGDGDLRTEYEKRAVGLPISFLGQKSHDEVLQLMAESKATVLPSEWWETFGLTVVESMQVGTPVVVSDLGALPDIVNHACGEVFKAGDAAELAKAIARLLSRADYDEVCLACRKRVEERYLETANYRDLKKVYLVA